MTSNYYLIDNEGIMLTKIQRQQREEIAYRETLTGVTKLQLDKSMVQSTIRE